MGSHLASFSFPTAMLYGSRAVSELPGRLRQMGAHRALVVTEKTVGDTLAFDMLANSLGRANIGRSWEVFDGVHTNPVEQDVINAANTFRDATCDAVVAFGGAAALDVGKAMRLLIKKPGLKLKDYNFNDDWSNLPRCIAVPTTAGSGNEVRRCAAVTLTGTHTQAVLFLPRLMPKLVVLDPDLTRDLSAHQTAASGFEALTHCIESFTSPVYQPMCDGIALEGVRMCVDSLPRVVKNGHDSAARGDMLVAASMSGVVCQKDLGAASSIAQALLMVDGMNRGAATAVALPHVMHFNAQRKPGVYRRVGQACGLEVANVPPEVADFRTIEFLRKFVTDLGLKPGLHSYGVKDSQIDALAAQAFADPSHLTNPVPVNLDDFKGLFRAAL